MPELPEVQTIVNGLNQTICHQTIQKIDVFNKKTLDSQEAKGLLNKTIHSIIRKGKYIILGFENCDLVIHLRMTGQFFYFPYTHNYELGPYDRVAFSLSEGLLIFRDVRRFGTMKLCLSHKELLKKLGIDPLSSAFTSDYLINLFSHSKTGIKSFLLAQDKIAGLGNIYVDEALFLSRIHPESRVSNIAVESIRGLQEAIVEVLQKGLEAKGTSIGNGLGNYQHVNGRGKNQQTLLVYGRSKQDCMVCNTDLVKTKIAGRGTTFCSSCQILY